MTQTSTEKTFCCLSKNDFDKPFPQFRKPVENGCFSQDDTGTFLHDKSRLRFYYAPSDFENVCFDLKNGYSSMIKKDETKKYYLDDLLKWVMFNRKLFRLEVENLEKTCASDNHNVKSAVQLIRQVGLWERVPPVPPPPTPVS